MDSAPQRPYAARSTGTPASPHRIIGTDSDLRGAHMTTYGLLIFDGAEELDFAGPWEVFTTSRMLRDDADTAILIAERPGAVRCNKGMRVLPDHTLDDHPPLDVLLVPGGNGTRREVSNPAITDC